MCRLCSSALFILPALLSAASAGAQPPAPVIDIAVQCAGGRGFLMRLGAEEAVVRVYGRDVRLQRQKASTLRQYDSADAALVIDGDFVAFVMNDALDFDACHLVSDAAPAVLPGR